MAREDKGRKFDTVQAELDDSPASGQTDATRPSTDVSIHDLMFGADRDITTDQIN